MSSVTVTVLFTDLVGSTELMSRVGSVAADELRREHFALLRDAIADHDGHEVKNLGDGLMVVFEGVASALDAAVAMQQAVTARPPDAEPLTIKVGVAVGDAEIEDDDYFGIPVVEAARLCAKAGGGEILTTELVRMLGKGRSSVELDSIGALELKGLDEPVEAYRARWTPLEVADDRPPFPGRLQSSVPASFVGRSEEYDQLATAWKAVVGRDERQVALLSGEPGMGKTTLSARFATDVYDQGATVVYGRCDSDLGIPYQPWVELLTQLVAHAPEALLAAHVADRGGHLTRLVPDLARRVSVDASTGVDADTERFLLFECVTDLLERVSADRPVLVMLDDLHWADRPTVQLLRHVAMATPTMRVLVLGTFRDSDINAEHPLTEVLAGLHREAGTVRLALPGFGDDDVLELLETVAGHEMDENGVALRNALLAETAGNPFFVTEMLRHLADTGAIYQRDDGRWETDPDLRARGLPVSVREVVGHRLAGLGPDTERVLALASVIGRDFDLSLLADVARLDLDSVIDLCDAAVDASVLSPTENPDRYTFTHALIEHTLYESLSPARRSRAHHAIGEQLESIADADDGRIGELAYHWGQAVAPTDVTKAVRYATVAGDHALEQLAPDEALRWYTQALDLADRTPGVGDTDRTRVEILVGLGHAQRICGIADYRETLLRAAGLADEIDAVDLLVRATLANNRGWQSAIGKVDTERIAMIDRALERIDDPTGTDRARLLTLSCMERTYAEDLDTLLGIAQQAVAAARDSGDPQTLAYTLIRPCPSITAPSTHALRKEWSDEGARIADDLGGLALRHSGHTARMVCALEGGELAEIDRQAAILDEIYERRPDPTKAWTVAYQRVWRMVLHGDLAEADRLAEAALNLGTESGEPDALSIYGVQLTNIRWYQGRLHELIPMFEQLVADTPLLPAYRTALVLGDICAGETQRARDMLATEHTTGFHIPLDLGWSNGNAFWAEAAVRLADRDAAVVLHERLAPYHDQIVTTHISAFHAFAHTLGRLDHLLGRYDDAHRWFAEAMGIHEGLESPPLIAATNAAWADLLTDRNEGDDHDRARTMAESALTVASAGGYGYIADDARGVLERLGVS